MAKNVKLKITSDSKQAKADLKGVNSSIKKTVLQLGLATAGLLAMKKGFDFMSGSVKMAMEQEAIFKKLETTINLNGGSWDKAEGKIKSYFNTLQATTKYGDTDSAEMLSQLIAFSGDYQTSLDNLSLAQDMASSSAFSSESATRYLGMALSGNVEMLGRYVPELKSTNNELLKTMTASEKTEYALEVLRKKFGGMAAEELKTTAGQIQQLTNYWGDYREAIGDRFLNTVGNVSTSLIPIIDEWTTHIKLHAEEVDLTSDAYLNLGEAARENLVKTRQALIEHAIEVEKQPGKLQVWWRSFKLGIDQMVEFENRWLGISSSISYVHGSITSFIGYVTKLVGLTGTDSIIDEDKIAALTQEWQNLNGEIVKFGRGSEGLEGVWDIGTFAEQMVEATGGLKELTVSYKSWLQTQKDNLAKQIQLEGWMNKVKTAAEGGDEAFIALAESLGLLETPELTGLDAYLAKNQELVAAKKQEAEWNEEIIEQYPELAKAMGLIEAPTDDFLDFYNENIQTELGLMQSGMDAKLAMAQEYVEAGKLTEQEYIDFKEQLDDNFLEAKKQKYMDEHEFQMGLLDSMWAGYDTFVNSVLDMEMTGQERREAIWESMKSSFVGMLGDMLKDYIKKQIMMTLIGDTAKVAEVVKATATGAAITAAYTPAALTSTVATGGGAAATGAISFASAWAAMLGSIASYAQGGDFIVPQGYPNDSYPIMVESGERVQITPTNQVNNLDAEILNALNQIISKPVANTVVFDDIGMSRYVERGRLKRVTV